VKLRKLVISPKELWIHQGDSGDAGEFWGRFRFFFLSYFSTFSPNDRYNMIQWYNDTMMYARCMPHQIYIIHDWVFPNNISIYIMIEKTYGYLSHSMESHGIPLKNPIESWRHVPAREHIFFQKLGFDFQAPIISGTFGGVFRRSQPSMFDDEFFGCQNDSTHLTRSVFSFRCV